MDSEDYLEEEGEGEVLGGGAGGSEEGEGVDGDWTPLPLAPNCPPRYRHEAIHLGDKVIVFGGGTRDVCYGFQNVSGFHKLSAPSPVSCGDVPMWGCEIFVRRKVTKYDKICFRH